MKAVKIYPSPLEGDVVIPPSKSISHRMVICGGLADGESVIKNLTLSEDLTATGEGMEALGANMRSLGIFSEGKGENVVVIGKGLPELRKKVINCNESGSTLRFLIPIASLTGGEVTFTGRGKLIQRPIDTFCKIFEEQGIEYTAHRGGLPLTFSGKLKAGEYRIRGDISSQFISGLLMALPLIPGGSRIIITTPLESKGYLDLTLDALEKFSVTVENKNYQEFIIKGAQRYKPGEHRVEGDFSQGAFWLAGGVIGGDIRCKDLKVDSLQGDKAIVEIIRKMGGNLEMGPDFVKAGASSTAGITVDASQCPDLVPIVAVLGALSQGTTRIEKAKRLRIKESDRLQAISTELNKLGAKVTELPEGLVIRGQNSLKGGIVDSWNDHRIAMALAIASLRCREPVVIRNSEAVNKSYPAFWRDFEKLGGVIDEFCYRE